MNIIDFLDNDYTTTPCDRKNENDYLSFLTAKLAGYVDNIDALSEDLCVDLVRELKQQKSFIIKLNAMLCSVVDEYYKGLPATAFAKFKEWFDAPTNIHIVQKLYNPESFKMPDLIYRARAGFSGFYTKDEMFHIPYDKRHLIGSYRYSIPGFPCLYAGSSLYVCWLEIGRPRLDDIYAVVLAKESGRVLNIIDIGITPKVIAWRIRNEIAKGNDIVKGSRLYADILTRLLIWPLQAASSVRVAYPSDPFKPEYILPQLLTQYIKTSTNIDGIRYFSTKYRHKSDSFSLGCNYVFPVKLNLHVQHCPELKQMFCSSEVYSVAMISRKGGNSYVSDQPNTKQKIDLARGLETDYYETIFGKLEMEMIADVLGVH